MVGMAERAAWRDAIADELLEFLHLGKSSFTGAGPHDHAADAHFENSACAGLQSDFADFRGERCEQFLRHPRGAQQPAALRAVFNLDSGGFHEASLPFVVRHQRDADESSAFGHVDDGCDIFEREILAGADENDRAVLATAE